MKQLLISCIILLLLGIANLPIGYYTILRIAITIGAIGVIMAEPTKELNFWHITFGIVAIVFNPIIPVYLYDKSIWTLIDIITAILFITKLTTLKTIKNE